MQQWFRNAPQSLMQQESSRRLRSQSGPWVSVFEEFSSKLLYSQSPPLEWVWECSLRPGKEQEEFSRAFAAGKLHSAQLSAGSWHLKELRDETVPNWWGSFGCPMNVSCYSNAPADTGNLLRGLRDVGFGVLRSFLHRMLRQSCAFWLLLMQKMSEVLFCKRLACFNIGDLWVLKTKR